MKVNEEPKNWTLTKGATNTSNDPPNRSMKKKSAVFPLKEVSSSNLQYRDKKNMWKTKSKPV